MNLIVAHAEFALIQAGTQTIEVRVNNVKRRQLRPGNHLVFKDMETGQEIKKEVTGIDHFPTFAALFTRYSGGQVGFKPDATVDEETATLYQRYTPVQEKDVGVLAIHFK